MIRLKVRDTGSVKLTVSPAVVVHTGGAPYDGPYEVTPKVESQVLNTKSKVMRSDVTVNRIPIFETSNSAGGETVYIAADLNE